MPDPRNVKVVLVGDMCVGKTSLTSVFINDVFRERYSASVGGAFAAKTLPPPLNMTLQVWDTAGMERFRSMLPHFMRDAHCAIIVYDVCEKGSFLSVQDYWVDYVTMTANRDNMVKILVGNKVDMPKERWVVKDSEARRFAEGNDMTFVSTSAKLGVNVKELFHTVASEIKSKIPEPKDEYLASYLEPLGPAYSKKEKKCCLS